MEPLFVNEVSFGLVQEKLVKSVRRALGVPGEWTQEEMDKVLGRMPELEAKIEFATSIALYEISGRTPILSPR